MTINRTFRKYHRSIAIILSLPLLITVLTGVGYTIVGDWLQQRDLAEWLLQVHTLEIFKLGKIFPVVNGIALIGLLVTGISMTGLFRKGPVTRT
jgi:hypothetical protein